MRDLLESEEEIDVEAACHLLHDLYIVRKILGFAKRIDSNISEGADTADLIGHAEEFIRGVATDSIKANTLEDKSTISLRVALRVSMTLSRMSEIRSPLRSRP